MISDNARVARVRRRRLARNGERLWIPRGRYESQYGPYAVVDLHTNAVIQYGATLEDVERDLAG